MAEFDFSIYQGDPLGLMDHLRTFLEFWLGLPNTDYKINPEKLANLELPLPLKLYYAFPEAWRIALNKQDKLLNPEKLKYIGDKLIFLHENQLAWRWATKTSGDDPEVWVEEEKGIYKLISPSLACFLVTYSLMGCVFNAVDYFDDDSTEFIDKIQDKKTLLLDVPYAMDLRRSYYIVDENILVMADHWDGGSMAFYAFQSQAESDAFLTRLRAGKK